MLDHLFLCTGVIFAFFQSLGTVASTSDMLNKRHRLGDIAAAVHLSSLEGIPSGPLALFGSRFESSSHTSVTFISISHNWWLELQSVTKGFWTVV